MIGRSPPLERLTSGRVQRVDLLLPLLEAGSAEVPGFPVADELNPLIGIPIHLTFDLGNEAVAVRSANEISDLNDDEVGRQPQAADVDTEPSERRVQTSSMPADIADERDDTHSR